MSSIQVSSIKITKLLGNGFFSERNMILCITVEFHSIKSEDKTVHKKDLVNTQRNQLWNAHLAPCLGLSRTWYSARKPRVGRTKSIGSFKAQLRFDLIFHFYLSRVFFFVLFPCCRRWSATAVQQTLFIIHSVFPSRFTVPNSLLNGESKDWMWFSVLHWVQPLTMAMLGSCLVIFTEMSLDASTVVFMGTAGARYFGLINIPQAMCSACSFLQGR